MKQIYQYLVPLCLLASCGEAEQAPDADANPEVVYEEIAESTAEEAEAEGEEPSNEIEYQWDQDSLQVIMSDLEQRRQDMWFQLEDARSSLLKFSYSNTNDYESETTTWYFTQDFEPLFYYRDMGAEGGYMETDFYVLTDGQVSFAYCTQDDFEYPKKYYHYIDFFDGSNQLVGQQTRRYDEVVGTITELYVPEMNEYPLTYFDWMKEFTSDGFKADGALLINNQKSMEESIYGGSDMMGPTVSIDSALFHQLY